METRTARDLPPHTEIHYRSGYWAKSRPGHTDCWTNGTGAHRTDEQIDGMFADGAEVVHIPSRAVLERLARHEQESGR
jgi:hypothetical protein